jgi:hypothetical protein
MLAMAKTLMEELTNYEAWQIEKYGNIVFAVESTPAGDLMNSGLEELNRLAEWVFHQSNRDHSLISGLS